MNVAVTRARALLHIVGHRRWAARCGIPHLEALTRPQPEHRRPDGTIDARFESPWERRLYEALNQRGLQPVPQYPLLGRRLDLARTGEGKIPIDIEVDGARFHLEPDGSRKRDDIWRDITIRGAGWKVIRFWVYELRGNMNKSVDRIQQEWSKS